jgi:hypothetical protein
VVFINGKLTMLKILENLPTEVDKRLEEKDEPLKEKQHA